MTLASGTRLGPYEIVAPLGAGGMGEVYRARDTRLGRDVAIKVLPSHLSMNPEVRARFEREARTVSSLNHPHICTLHDIGREGDTDYLVMELVEGETLADRLTRGPLPVEQVLTLGAEIADALDRAHRAGIVHRDLKPGNIMLAKSGAKLMDFGLARTALAGAPGGSGLTVGTLTQSPTVAQPLTAQGSIVGTFQYMAPEQLEGTEADARSDIWALGCVLYEMTTGKRAFAGPSQASLISSIMKDTPQPIAQLQTLTPPGLERLITACLAKNPEDRIQTAHDVKLHLRWIAEGGSLAGVPAPVAARRKSRERLAWALLAVLGVSTGALAMRGFGRRAPEPQLLRFQITSPAAIQTQDAPRISPDGRAIAFSATDSTGTARVWVRSLSALTAQALPGTDGVLARPFWSPDSRFLAFMAGGKLKKISVTGGPPAVICDAPSGWDGTWGREGVILFDGTATDPIRRVAAAGGVAAPAVGADSTIGVQGVGWPEFLPDGKHFFYLAIGREQTLRVGSIDSKETQDLGPCESQVQYIPSGHLLFSRGGSLVIQRFDPGKLKLLGDPAPVAEQVAASSVGQSDFRASDNGILVYSTRLAASGRLVEFDRTGKELRILTSPPEGFMPMLSPDERRLAVRAVDSQVRTRDIWLIDRVRDITSRFTFDKSNENYPLWSPDGKSIAYWSDAAGASGIVVKQLTGSGETELLMPQPQEIVLKNWSRDGSTILYDSFVTSTTSDIWLLSTITKKARPFLTGSYNEFDPRLSPDGRLLAYTSNESGRNEVYVQSYPDQSDKWQVSTRGGREPLWRADGREIFYLSPDGQVMSAAVGPPTAFDPAPPVPLFRVSVLLPEINRAHYAVTGDGQTFIVFVAGERSLPSTTVVVNWMAEMAGK